MSATRLGMMGMTQGVFDGNKLYTIALDDYEITVSDLDPEEDKNVTPSKLLTFTRKAIIYSLDIRRGLGEGIFNMGYIPSIRRSK